jgi:hypothetical protein
VLRAKGVVHDFAAAELCQLLKGNGIDSELIVQVSVIGWNYLV